MCFYHESVKNLAIHGREHKGNIMLLNRINWCQDKPNIMLQASWVDINYFSSWAKY